MKGAAQPSENGKEKSSKQHGRSRGEGSSGAAAAAVRLVVDAKGDVVSVVDQHTGKSVTYTIGVSWDDAEDMPALFEALRLKASTTLHGGCTAQCGQCGGVGCLLGVSRTTLTVWKRHVSQCLVFLPLFNCRQESPARFPTGCAYVLPADAAPSGSFFPFGLDYCAGITMVELESRLDDKGLVLTPDFFLTEDMRLRRDTFTALAYGETDPDALPGVVLHDTLKDLQPFTSSRYPKDPLLRTFRADFSPSVMRMGADDWAFVGTSVWADASDSTKEVAGHTGNQQHFYLAVKYSLPPEVCDQIAHLVRANPKKDTWKQLAERKVFERAHALAESIREHFVTMALNELGLQRKRSNPESVHTSWNVLDSTPIQVKATTDEGASVGVCYYSGCTPTHRARRGVLVPRGDADAGVLWFHGEPSGFVGGRAWKQPQSVSAFPCTLGAEQKWTKREIKLLQDAGWDPANGFVKVDSLVRLKL